MKVRTVLPFLALALMAAPLAAQEDRTIRDGVYTDEQALRGEDVFYTICTGCHEVWEFTDAIFHENWTDQPVYFIAKEIKDLMPDDDPGTREGPEVMDVLSYILQLNGYPAGEAEPAAATV